MEHRLILLLLMFILSFLFVKSNATIISSRRIKTQSEKFHDRIVNNLRADRIRDNLKYFSQKPHNAGSERNNEIIQEIHKRFKWYGFDSTLHKYDVPLSFPERGKLNHAYILDTWKGEEVFKSKGKEDALFPEENDSSAMPPFNAFGPAGTATGDIVYVNYARFEDFEELEKEYNISCQGKIVLSRYGKIFRGDKVKNAEDRGAVGVLLYSDPFDVGPVPQDQLYPKGRWLSRDGIQRGSVMIGANKLTPGYPAKDWAFKSKIADMKDVPNIVVQPISALDASEYFKRMGGEEVPEKWKGSLKVRYNFGGFINADHTAKIQTHNTINMTRITNVVGTIPGSDEPDRYVLMGNHIDAWVFGAVDPSSGTACMLEIARVLGNALAAGWRPKRTIKLCGWDGEEQGLFGSIEWVEEFATELRDRAVAYINLDSAVGGNYSLEAKGSPLLHEFILSVLKDVDDPYNASMTVSDKAALAKPDKNHPGQPKIGGIGSGSDYFGFYQMIGVASIDLGYRQGDLNNKYKIGSYPMYHSLHDTFHWMKTFTDKEFKCHLTISKVTAYLLLRLADADIVPFYGQRYADALTKALQDLSMQLDKKVNVYANISTGQLVKSVQKFSTAVNRLREVTGRTLSVLQRRMLNDELMQLEKGFIYSYGLPGRPFTKHYLMAPSLKNSYGASSFPAVADLLWDIEKTQDYDSVRRQITITTYLIDSVATKILSFVKFMD